ncbi:MAG: outer membrane lipoprotein-sorting protein [Pseudomonadota bacterium]
MLSTILDRFRSGLTVAALLLAGSALANDALQLVQQVHDRPVGRDVTTVSRMELTDRAGSRRTRELVTYRMEQSKGEFASLARFLAPADIAGTGLLSLDKADGSSEQWLYLPAMDRVRRVASDRKGGRFVGSDLYFEDLQTRKPESDSHRSVGRETLDGVACEIVESVPVDPGNSVYKRRLLWIDPQLALVMRIDYFEKDESKPSKRWVLLAKQRIQGYWAPMDSKTTDLVTGNETRMLAQTIKFDRKLPSKLFTSRALSDETIEAGHRP